MTASPNEKSPISRWLPGPIPNIFLALCIRRNREHKTVPSDAANTIQWIVDRDAPEFARTLVHLEHRDEYQGRPTFLPALYCVFVHRKPLPDEGRMILESLLQRRMQNVPANVSSTDPNNIPCLRAAFLAHILQSVAPTEEESRARIMGHFRTINPPGSTNEERIKNARRHARRRRRRAPTEPLDPKTLIEVANRMGWLNGGQPDTERVARAVKDHTQFILRFLAMMYGRQPNIMEQASRDELLSAMDIAEEQAPAIH